MNMLKLSKHDQLHMFRYAEGDEEVMIQELIRKAEDPTCPLDWFDAAILSHQMTKGSARKMYDMVKTKGGDS